SSMPAGTVAPVVSKPAALANDDLEVVVLPILHQRRGAGGVLRDHRGAGGPRNVRSRVVDRSEIGKSVLVGDHDFEAAALGFDDAASVLGAGANYRSTVPC